MLALIGFDSVSLPLIEELVDEGRMPSFAAMRDQGTTIPLDTPGRWFSAASFPSLWTGKEVEEHGLYYPFLWSGADQRVIVATSRPAPRAFWEPIADTGRRVLVVDPYEGRPPARPVSTCLSGIQFQNRVVLPRWSSPPGALRTWERRLGRGRPANEVFGRQSVRSLTRFASTLRAASGRAAQLVETALAEEQPDLLVVMLPAVHLAGHKLWDPASVLPDGNVDGSLAGALKDVYASADAALGRIHDALPEGADVIVFSVLGMGANTSRNDLLPDMLSAVLASGPSVSATSSAWRIRASIPTPLRAAVANALPERLALDLAARTELRGVDWATTRAFCVPSDSQGLVRVNQAGREASGVVPGEEVDALLDEIEAGLTSFEEPDGAPVISTVHRVRDVVSQGPASDLLPDLVVQWRPTAASGTEAVSSPRFGTVRRFGAGTGRSGNHTDDAWAIVRAGTSRIRSAGRRHRVTDLAHTAFALCGAPAGGEPLLEPVST